MAEPLALKYGRKSVLFVPVVRPALQNLYAILINAIDEPVDRINSPAPIALKNAFRWFRLAYALVSVAVNVLQQKIDSLDRFLS